MVQLLKIVLALVLFGWAAWYIEPARMVSAAKDIGWEHLLVGALLALAGVGIQWLKWQRLLRTAVPDSGWREGLYSLLGGSALGLVTPGRVGEIGRGLFLGGARGDSTVLAGVDKLSSAAVTVALGGVGSWILWPEWRVGILVALSFGVVVGGWGWKWGRGRWGILQQVRGWWGVLAMSLGFNLVFMLQFYWFFTASGSTGVIVALAVPVVFAVKTLLPLTFMDIGIREAAAVWVFTALGLEANFAFVASVLVFAFNVCLPAVAGWLWIGGRVSGVGKGVAMMRKVVI